MHDTRTTKAITSPLLLNNSLALSKETIIAVRREHGEWQSLTDKRLPKGSYIEALHWKAGGSLQAT